MNTPEPANDLECLDVYQEAPCTGRVEYRAALTGTGKSFPRCDGHWAARLRRQDEINERYPDSPIPPPGFDPDYAGERWNDDY